MLCMWKKNNPTSASCFTICNYVEWRNTTIVWNTNLFDSQGRTYLPFKKLLWEASVFSALQISPRNCIFSCFSLMLKYNAVGNALSWLCCSWSALSFWHYSTFALVPNLMMNNVCQTRQISAQSSMKITRIISQSTALLNLMSCPRKKLKMQGWSIYRYSLICAEY